MYSRSSHDICAELGRMNKSSLGKDGRKCFKKKK